MDRPKITQAMINAYDEYTHLTLDRRDFMQKLQLLAGSAAGWLIVTELMHLKFAWQPLPAIAATAAAVLVTVALGLAGTFSALGQKPAPVLRNL